jgi:AraC family transcriptional regulator of adaptative response/methylated-DNA-[protein]-cysteine methyltransferase
VQFHETWEEAEKAGFRACKRCKPKEPSLVEQNAAKIAKACRLIEKSEESPSLSKLAKYDGMRVFHSTGRSKL